MQEIRKAVPVSAAYLSESNFFAKEWQRAFWGGHYRQLVAIKAKHDRDGLLFVHHGVGSESWRADGFQG
jgi:hypothetical protein